MGLCYSPESNGTRDQPEDADNHFIQMSTKALRGKRNRQEMSDRAITKLSPLPVPSNCGELLFSDSVSDAVVLAVYPGVRSASFLVLEKMVVHRRMLSVFQQTG